jgi:hypothetical protein
MWLFPFLLAFNHNLLLIVLTGMVAGSAHGGARALGILNNVKAMQSDAELSDLRILGMQLRWQFWDGLALLLAAGALSIYLLALI